MSQPRTVGMLINHRDIDHILTSMSDTLRNAAYKVAKDRGYDEMFDETGTLIGYDEDSNKALLKDCLDHYVQYCNVYGSAERTDFNYYLADSFDLVAEYCTQDDRIISYLTSLFSQACGILANVLQPAMADIHACGQLVDKIESYATSFENTFYLVYGEDIDNPESYDPTEDDLSTVDCSQTPEELMKLEVKRIAKEAWNEATGDKTCGEVLDASPYSNTPNVSFRGILPRSVNPMTGITKEHISLNNVWKPDV